jgi:nucleoside-diphosphate-sugar epimerase
MKILVTGATGYIGGAVAKALLARSHEVFGLARSEASADRLRKSGIGPVIGDFTNASSLAKAISTSNVDAVISTASVGSIGGDAGTYAQDRDAVNTMLRALGNSGKTLIFTSGSSVLGVFNGGNLSDSVYTEDHDVPLSPSMFAPSAAKVHPMMVEEFGAAMVARVETERAVISAPGVRGIVVRPGLVYGYGGSYDLPALIKMARANKCAAHLGSGTTRQSYVHLDDLADLYCLAVERAPKGATFHGVVDEVSQRDLAMAVSRMIGAGDRTESFTMPKMLGFGWAEQIGLSLTKVMPRALVLKLQSGWTPPSSAATGLRLCLNKRLSSRKTSQLLNWKPSRTDILKDLEFGSYAV